MTMLEDLTANYAQAIEGIEPQVIEPHYKIFIGSIRTEEVAKPYGFGNLSMEEYKKL